MLPAANGCGGMLPRMPHAGDANGGTKIFAGVFSSISLTQVV
jgi:hypothetical protein